MGMSIHIADDWLHLRYGTFGQMRRLLSDAAGYDATRQWSAAEKQDVLVSGLMRRYDVSDAIPHTQCHKLAKRIRELIPLVKVPKRKKDEVDQVELINAFVEALERCAKDGTGLGWN